MDRKLKIFCIGILVFLFLLPLNARAQQQDGQNEPDPEEMAEKEAERLGEVLKLEYWQVFYVDSTLRHNNTAMLREMKELQRAKVENVDLYYAVQDKWQEATEKAYRKFFTDGQWDAYLKQGGARIIKDRERRQAQSEESSAEKQNKKKKKK